MYLSIYLTLARPTAPLAACLQRHMHCYFNNWLPWQHPIRDQNIDFRLFICSRVLTILKIWREDLSGRFCDNLSGRNR